MKMNKMLQKSLGVVMCVSIMMCSMVNTVFAENDEFYSLTYTPSYIVNNNVDVYDNTYPNSVWNLKTSGMYNVSGSANGKADLFTLYRYTGVDSIAISITNNSANTLTVKCYKHTLLTTQIGSFTVPANSTKSQLFTDLDENSSYYFTFSSPCNFSGYIA